MAPMGTNRQANNKCLLSKYFFIYFQYTGLWHDIASYSNRFQVGTCNNARYTLVTDYVDVLKTQVIGQSLNVIKGVARVASTDGSAKLTVTFPIAGSNRKYYG